CRPASFDADVAAVGPTELCQSLEERRVADLTFRIIRGRGVQHTDPPHAAWLLRMRRERPRRRAAEERDERAALHHSITSSASNCSALGTSMPSARAVCRLITNSNLVDCKTGRSAGFAPLRI